MSAHLDEPRVKLDRVAAPRQHRRAQVVIQDHPRHTAQRLEGPHVAPQEVLQALVEEELQRQRARVRQRQHEAAQAPSRLAHADFAEVCPVGLGLLTGKRPAQQEGLLVAGAKSSHKPCLCRLCLDRPAARGSASRPRASAFRLPVWSIIVLTIGMELFVGYLIRDNLTLNIIMLIYPFQSILAWQTGVG